MVVKCPNCYSTRVSKCEEPNIKWQCDKCNRKFNQGAYDIGAEMEKAEQLRRERRERESKERIEREEKGIYLDKSLDLLGDCNAGVIRILFDKFAIYSIGTNDDEIDYIALNFPTKDIEIAIKEAEEQIERERKETLESLDLLSRCSTRVLRILYYGKLNREIFCTVEVDKLNNQIALNFSKKDIEIGIKEAEEQIEREEKGIYLDKSLDLLRECNQGVLEIIYDKFNVSNDEEKLNSIAFNYPTKYIENTIKEAENQIEKERLEKERVERERIEKERKERLERERKERLEKERKERLEKERKERLEKERSRKELITILNKEDNLDFTTKVKLRSKINEGKIISKEQLSIEIEKERKERLEKNRKEKTIIEFFENERIRRELLEKEKEKIKREPSEKENERIKRQIEERKERKELIEQKNKKKKNNSDDFPTCLFAILFFLIGTFLMMIWIMIIPYLF